MAEVRGGRQPCVRGLWGAVLLAALCGPAQAPAQSPAPAQAPAATLRRDFINPPADTRPGCYWYWMNDNITTAGISRDLEAMARVGIGRAFIGHIFDRKSDKDTPVGDVPFMSNAWWQAVQWAVKEADRLGVDIGFFNAPGWSQSGGSWIKPDQSMRYLGHSETEVAGGGAVDVVLPVPPMETFPNSGGHSPQRHGPNFTDDDFQDVKVIAYRLPDAATGRIAVELSSFSGETSEARLLLDNDPATFALLPVNTETSITLRLPSDATTTAPVQTALIKVLDHSYIMEVTAEESDDGESFRLLTTYREPRGHQGPKKDAELVVPLGPVRGNTVRLIIKFAGGAANRKLRVAEVALSSEALLAGHVRKQLGETSPDIIVPPDAYTWQPQPPVAEGAAIAAADVLDLTERLTTGGRLQWNAPPGRWNVLRMGMIPIGTMCAPCSPESRGLEIDKMNSDHARSIFEGMVGEFLRRTPEGDRKALKYIIADSYETGPQNWTDGMADKFRKRFGYSPEPYLPVLTGRVVESAEVSDRFLWDLRRLVVEGVAYDYVGGLREIANQHKLKLWLENYGHWGFISEFLLYGSQTDEIGGEFWESSDPIGNVECRAAASAAHIYGKNPVYVEAFTSGRTFKQSPSTLKRWCDWAFGTGMNHFILHVNIHQPDERKPGIIAWFGTAFNRHNTWFEPGKAFLKYIQRGAVMLKAGQPMADAAYYIGENAPNMQGPMQPELPPGYDYDSINSDVLIGTGLGEAPRVVNGRITLPHGVSYAALVLPKDMQMRPEVAEAISNLVRQGAVVIGPRPQRSPSLQGYPGCDARLAEIADDLWGKGDTPKEGRQVGKGFIHSNPATLAEVFERHGITPAVDIVSSPTLLCTVAGTGKLGVNDTGGILFKHRQDGDRDIYFLSNTSLQAADLSVSFRRGDGTPSLWNAVTGDIREARAFTRQGGCTVLPLHLQASESIYVVFESGKTNPAGGSDDAISNNPSYETVATLQGPWTVQFDGPGAPGETTFAELTDWTQHADEKVRYFSGTATYSQQLALPAKGEGRLVLDLGSAGVIATVLVNGKEGGTAWTNPWTVDVTDHLREGDNQLEIRVANTWNNRLVGQTEGKYEGGSVYVSMPYSYPRDNPLLPSGLHGPVRLLRDRNP